MIYRKEKECGAVFVELILALPILLIILAGAFEVSRIINYKNAAIQLSTQAANQVYRECTSEKGILMSDCIQRVQRDMTSFAMENYPDDDGTGASHVAITVFFNKPAGPITVGGQPQFQYTARAGADQFPNSLFLFNVNEDRGITDRPIAINDWDAIRERVPVQDLVTIFNGTGYLVVAQSYLRYKPTVQLFGSRMFSGDYIVDFTII